MEQTKRNHNFSRWGVRRGLPLGRYFPELFATIHGNKGDLTYPLAKSRDVDQFLRTGASIVEVNDDEFNPWFRTKNDDDVGYLASTRENIKYCKKILD